MNTPKLRPKTQVGSDWSSDPVHAYLFDGVHHALWQWRGVAHACGTAVANHLEPAVTHKNRNHGSHAASGGAGALELLPFCLLCILYVCVCVCVCVCACTLAG